MLNRKCNLDIVMYERNKNKYQMHRRDELTIMRVINMVGSLQGAFIGLLTVEAHI